MITDQQIYKSLYDHFHTHDYKLMCSFVYAWESDFFCRSQSGYFVEVEVKVSRGDFARDFDKGKHRLFQSIVAGRTHHIAHREGRGDKICNVVVGQMVTNYGEYAKHSRYGGKGNWNYESKNGKWGVWANDYGNIAIRHYVNTIYARASHIHITPIDKIHCPNQFYFAVPKGMIKREELPAYAGLIEIKDDGVADCIKRAPYMHKRKQDLAAILLKKFHGLWAYKVSRDKKVEIHRELKEQPGDIIENE